MLAARHFYPAVCRSSISSGEFSAAESKPGAKWLPSESLLQTPTLLVSAVSGNTAAAAPVTDHWSVQEGAGQRGSIRGT